MDACDHFIAGRRFPATSTDRIEILNPATGTLLAELPCATSSVIHEAVASAKEAFARWCDTPVIERARVLFRFQNKLEEHRRELVELVVLDNGKTLAEANGEVQRGIEAVEFATGIPSQIMGTTLEEVARGIDCEMFRQSLGIVTGFTPFNFPVMVPLWMIPVALACGNTFILKPSERAPLASLRLAEIFAECGAPPGTLNVVHGSRSVAEALMEHPDVQAVSIVGSSPVAQQVYTKSAACGKRVQALGGAKNALVVMPDADLNLSVESVIASAFGCAGQRCLAGSNVIAVGNISRKLVPELSAAASQLRLGPGIDPQTKMGPVISTEARERVHRYVSAGLDQGAKLAFDGRTAYPETLGGGYFVGPTILQDVHPGMSVAQEEIFGPVLSVIEAATLDEAIDLINQSPFGNSASIYTSSGAAARIFRRRIESGMLGINLGVPAPMAFMPFCGWKGSFYGDLHAQGKEAVEFYTRRKVVTSRWGESETLWKAATSS